MPTGHYLDRYAANRWTSLRPTALHLCVIVSKRVLAISYWYSHTAVTQQAFHRGWISAIIRRSTHLGSQTKGHKAKFEYSAQDY